MGPDLPCKAVDLAHGGSRDFLGRFLLGVFSSQVKVAQYLAITLKTTITASASVIAILRQLSANFGPADKTGNFLVALHHSKTPQ